MVEKKTVKSQKPKTTKKKDASKKPEKKTKPKKATLKEKNLENKQLAWFFGIIALGFILFLGSYFYQNNYVNNFEFAGVEWEKVDDNGQIYWHSRFRLSEDLPFYNAWLTNDPRKVNYPIEGTLGVRRAATLSLDPTIEACGGNTTHMGLTHGIFMKAVKIELDYTYTNEERANQSGLEAVTCEDSSDKLTVYVAKMGEETVIRQNSEYPNCFEMIAETCEDVIPLGERFIIGVLGKQSGEKI